MGIPSGLVPALMLGLALGASPAYARKLADTLECLGVSSNLEPEP